MRLLRDTDRNAGLLRAVRVVRRSAPGGDRVRSITGARTSDRIARLLTQAGAEQPSAARELGLTAIQVWQSLAGARRDQEATDLTILFTDLVGFSSWALRVGDEPLLRLLREVGQVTETAVARHGGSVVKSLGDGVMAVFADTGSAIAAADEACTAVSALTVDGYRPQLRTGLHTGRPHRVGDDYLGVDVNVAARVAAAASGGEVLASEPALSGLDPQRYVVRRRRRLRAKGAPKDLDVYAVIPL